jgi:hypothetical protein
MPQGYAKRLRSETTRIDGARRPCVRAVCASPFRELRLRTDPVTPRRGRTCPRGYDSLFAKLNRVVSAVLAAVLLIRRRCRLVPPRWTAAHAWCPCAAAAS